MIERWHAPARSERSSCRECTRICSATPTWPPCGVSLRDVQIAARHADPKTTKRYDRARKNLDDTPTTPWPRTWPPERSRRSSINHPVVPM
jgi:hypothetical protein